MRFITIASLFYISSSLNGCSKTGDPTPEAHSTSSRDKQTFKTSKAEEDQDNDLATDVKVDGKSKTVDLPDVGSKNSDVVIMKKKKKEPAVYEDPFPGLHISGTENYTPKEISEMKFNIRETVLEMTERLPKKEIGVRIAELIKRDNYRLNRQYIDQILYSNIERLMDVTRGIENLRAKIKKEEELTTQLKTLEDNFNKERNGGKRKVLRQKIESIKALLLNKEEVDKLSLEKDHGEKILGDLYKNKIDAFINRIEKLDIAKMTLERIKLNESQIRANHITRDVIAGLEKQLKIANESKRDNEKLKEIRERLNLKKNLDRKSIIKFIAENISKKKGELLTEERLKELKQEIVNKEAYLAKLFGNSMELVEEQIKIAKPKKI